MLRAIILASLSTVVLSTVTVNCGNNEDLLRITGGSRFISFFYRLQDGSTLTRCAVNQQQLQCCSQLVLDFVDHALAAAVNNETIISRFTSSAFATAEDAIEEMRNKTEEILQDITENNIRPLLLSVTAVKPPTEAFKRAVDTAMSDFHSALNGSKVDLKNTVFTFFRAVAKEYYNVAIEFVEKHLDFGFFRISLPKLNPTQEACVIGNILKQIYSDTDGTDELINLLQNAATAVGVIKQLPFLYDQLLVQLKSFKFSQSCLDVFLENFLCPFCSNQPKMCPGRCSEIVVGCLSPLHQVIEQLDASFRLLVSIIKSMTGSPDKVTSSVDINRIPVLYDRIIASLKRFNFLNFDFIKQLLTSCEIKLPSLFGKRDANDYLTRKYKRQLNIPTVKFDKSLFDKLKTINTLGSDQIASAIETFCSPNFSVPISGHEFKITAENGNCSYGLNNCGAYNSSFDRGDVVDQVHENPAGHFNYTELIDETKKYTYVVTELFNNTDIPESVFSTFLPKETLPTTTFHDARPRKTKKRRVKYLCYPTPTEYVYSALKFTSRKEVDYVCYPRN